MCCMAQIGYSDDSKPLLQEDFDAEVEALVVARDAKKITELQYAQRAARAIKKFMPEAYELHTLADYRVLLATKLEKKKVSREDFEYSWSERWNEYLAKVKKSKDQATAEEEYRQVRQDMAQQDKMRREQAYRENVAIAEAEAARQQQVLNNAALLQGIGNAFTRTYRNPSVTCSSLPVGASVSTTCY